MKQVILYGFSGPADQYRVVRYYRINGYYISIDSIKYCAQKMKRDYPNIVHIYAIDNKFGLRQDYIDSIKKNTIESCAIFKDLLEREGLKII